MVPVALSEAEWSPFGWLPVADVDPRDGKETLTFEWADAHVNLIGHARAEVPETASGLRCEMLFRHDTHTQALMPLNVPAVIVVAPADVEFADQDQAQADLASIRAFRIEPLESLVLHRGTWHWGPFPLRGTRGPALQCPGSPLRRGQPLRGPGLQGSRRRDRGRGRYDGPAGQRSLRWRLTRPKKPRSYRPPWPSWSTPSPPATQARTPRGGRPSSRPARSGGCTVASSAAWWSPRR